MNKGLRPFTDHPKVFRDAARDVILYFRNKRGDGETFGTTKILRALLDHLAKAYPDFDAEQFERDLRPQDINHWLVSNTGMTDQKFQYFDALMWSFLNDERYHDEVRPILASAREDMVVRGLSRITEARRLRGNPVLGYTTDPELFYVHEAVDDATHHCIASFAELRHGVACGHAILLPRAEEHVRSSPNAVDWYAQRASFWSLYLAPSGGAKGTRPAQGIVEGGAYLARFDLETGEAEIGRDTQLLTFETDGDTLILRERSTEFERRFQPKISTEAQPFELTLHARNTARISEIYNAATRTLIADQRAG